MCSFSGRVSGDHAAGQALALGRMGATMAKDGKKKAGKSDGGGGSTPSTSGADTHATTPKPPPPATVPARPSGSGSGSSAGDGPSRPTVIDQGRSGDTGSAAPTGVETTTPTGALSEPGGDAAETARRASPGSSAALAVPTATPVEALRAPAGRSRATAARPEAQVVQTSDLVDGVADVLRAPLRVADRVLPAGRTPMVLGVAALTLVGVLDWPAAVAIGLGYEALRRWAPDKEHTPRS